MLIYKLIFLILLLNNCEKVFYEKENNNTINKANLFQINKLNTYKLIQGKINHVKDVDFYQLNINSNYFIGKLLSIELEGIKGFDLQFSVYSNGKIIKKVDSYRKNKGEQFKNLLIKNNNYKIKVEVSKYHSIFEKIANQFKKNTYPSENYQLKLKLNTINSKDIEPNDNLNQATEIYLNEKINGYYSPFYNSNKLINNIDFLKSIKNYNLKEKEINFLKNLDFDVYSIKIPLKGLHRVSLLLEKTPDVDSLFMVYSKSKSKKKKSLFYIVNNYSFNMTEQVVNLTFKGKKYYYIIIAGIPKQYHSYSNKIYSYQFKIINRSVNNINNILEEHETNNSFKTANLVTAGKVIAYLSPANDLDYFYFRVPLENKNKKNNKKINFNNEKNKPNKKSNTLIRKKFVNVNLKGIKGIDLLLYLFNQKKKLLKVYDNASISVGEKIINYNLGNMKGFYLLVKGKYKNKNEYFNTPYTLTTNFELNSFGLEIEPNDVNLFNKSNLLNKAHILSINQIIKGYINPKSFFDHKIKQKNDIDMYKIRLKYNTKYYLIFKGIKNTSLELNIYDKNFYPLKDFKAIKLNTNKKVIRSIFESQNLSFSNKKDNLYYIQIKSNSNKKYSILNSYEIILKKK